MSISPTPLYLPRIPPDIVGAIATVQRAEQDPGTTLGRNLQLVLQVDVTFNSKAPWKLHHVYLSPERNSSL
jgi:hypothetical protein